MAQGLRTTDGVRRGGSVNFISGPNCLTIPPAAAAATLDLLPVLYMQNEFNLFRSSGLDAIKVNLYENSADQ